MDGSFKDGLDTLVRGGVRAIVIGTRQSDPNAKGQDVFCPSSEGWPPFMRVNPILDWTYADVWSFLLLIKVSGSCPLVPVRWLTPILSALSTGQVLRVVRSGVHEPRGEEGHEEERPPARPGAGNVQAGVHPHPGRRGEGGEGLGSRRETPRRLRLSIDKKNVSQTI
mmetsp:Transcript_12381/g.34463  ORF Transcript_12381/g.34463 Transcript_12381/m.34463 type:complete len:167 (+) Transcript_12381:304-804(+)